jgi:hypothetical protein
VGYKQDRFKLVDGTWKIGERMIVVDHDKLTSYLGLL